MTKIKYTNSWSLLWGLPVPTVMLLIFSIGFSLHRPVIVIIESAVIIVVSAVVILRIGLMGLYTDGAGLVVRRFWRTLHFDHSEIEWVSLTPLKNAILVSVVDDVPGVVMPSLSIRKTAAVGNGDRRRVFPSLAFRRKRLDAVEQQIADFLGADRVRKETIL